MLKLNPAPTFTVPVEITVPGQDKPEILRVTFKHKSAEALAAWFKDSAETPLRDALDGVIEDWKGVIDDKGIEVPYSLEALDRLMSAYGPAGRELLKAYGRSLTESRAKN